MTYTFERLDVRSDDWPTKIDGKQTGTIYQTPTWPAFLSRDQNGELVVGAIREGRETICYFAGLIVRKLGLRILCSPFPGWSTEYRYSIDFAFQEIGCVHVEITDRHITEEDFCGLEVQYKCYRSFEVDLTQNENEPFANMMSDCPRLRVLPVPLPGEHLG